MSNLALYLTVVLIWGTTWLPIQYQIGSVPAEISIIYRFLLSALILFAWGALKHLPFKFTLKQHAGMALQGIFLFGVNYVFIYHGSQFLTSGLVAVLFSTLVLMNIINSAVFLKHKVDSKLMLGVLIGLLGVCFTFSEDLLHFNFRSGRGFGVLLCFASVFCASLGNMSATRNQKAGIPILQGNAWGMAYGAFFISIGCAVTGTPVRFGFSWQYTISLLYLSILGSVIAFQCYLILLGRIGASRASYVTVVFPIVALALSTWLEDYHWTAEAVIGVLLILAGNVLVLSQNIIKKNLK